MFLLQTLSAYFCMLIVTPLWALIVVFLAIPDSTGRLWQPVVRVWARVALLLGGAKGLILEGEVAFEEAGGRVLMANHQSHLDPLAICLVCSDPVRFLTKRSLFFFPIFGQALWLTGMIPIDRRNRAHAFASIDRAVARVRDGFTVLVFPEGTRSTTAEMLPYKKGGFVLAIRSGAPIIPVGISGTERIMPPGWRCRGRSLVSVVIGEAVDTSRYTMETRHDLVREVRQRIEALRVRAHERLAEAEAGSDEDST